ncbi:MAG: hypothetical protein UH788_01125 [Treponemataceae bacterium]|nr:hypothetical protein [Treponemataceae bacterium]
MKKLIIYLCIFVSLFVFSCKKNEVENSNSEVLTSSKRSVIIVNKTESEVFKSCSFWTHDGIKVDGIGFDESIRVIKDGQGENITIKNIDEKEGFENYDKFKIVLIDSMGIKFEKEFVANEEGETVVTISEDDMVKSYFFLKFNRAVQKI